MIFKQSSVKKIIPAFLFYLFLAFNAQATEQKLQLIVESDRPFPKSEVVQEWVTDLYENQPEIWVIENFDVLKQTLEESDIKIPEQNRPEILPFKQLYAIQPLITFIPDLRKTKYIIASSDFKNSLSHDLLSKIYAYLLKTYHYTFAAPTISNEATLKQSFKSQKVTNADWELIKKNIYQIDGQKHLLCTPDIWELLPLQVKEQIVFHYLDDKKDSQRGFQVFFKIPKNSDIQKTAQEISEKYITNKNPKQIEKILRDKFDKATDEFITIPLQDFLHGFIQKNINKYTINSGATCYYAVANVANKSEDDFYMVDEKKLGEDFYVKFIQRIDLLQSLPQKSPLSKPETFYYTITKI